jgi:hypothetical protein
MTSTTMRAYECPECEHQWRACPKPAGHEWDTCPECGADDGLNCWDCGEPSEEYSMGLNMCSACRRTMCPTCERSHLSSSGREADGGDCGQTGPVL